MHRGIIATLNLLETIGHEKAGLSFEDTMILVRYTEKLEALIKEVVKEEPVSDCATGGRSCAFLCEGDMYKNPPVHDKNCWLTRAKSLLEES